MNTKYLWVVLITLVLFGCDDNTGSLGLGVLPDSDGISVKTTTFDVQTESTVSGPVFAKTNIGYVGRFTDKEYGFGFYEGSFLAEISCVDDFKFPEPYDFVNNRNQYNMISEDLDKSFVAAQLIIGYTEFFGDSLNPIQIGVYELDKKLDKNHYTDIDPYAYLSPNKKPLGTRTATAVDLSDSTRFSSDYVPNIVIPLPDNFGKNLIQQNWDHPEDFKDPQTFIDKVLKGLYIKNEAGDGTVLYVEYVYLEVAFNYFVLDSLGNVLKLHDESGDSIKQSSCLFASSMEVIQANQIKTSEEVIEKVENEEEKKHTYLKSPAGIFTRAKLPIGDIVRGLELDKDTINAAKLTLTGYYHKSENPFSMNPPSSVLLVREKDAKEFFELNQLPNSANSYVANYSNNEYTFNNLTRLITAYVADMEKAKEEEGSNWDEDEWLEKNQVLIIPVALGTQQMSNGTISITNVRHDLKPAFVKLKGGDPNKGGFLIDLQVKYSQFNQ